MSSCVVAVRAATPADLGDIVRLYLVLRDHHHELEPTNARYLVDKTEWELVVKRALEDPRAGSVPSFSSTPPMTSICHSCIGRSRSQRRNSSRLFFLRRSSMRF
jgi:hypothetical protein